MSNEDYEEKINELIELIDEKDSKIAELESALEEIENIAYKTRK